MGCCHYYAPTEGGDTAFMVDTSTIVFGPGVLAEVGDHARAMGMRRAALFTDAGLAGLGHVAIARRALEDAGDPPSDGFFALPGMPNAHSHSFQRALCGYGEAAQAEDAGKDSFWSWREHMYRLAGKITEQDLYVIATQAFADMLAAGFTSVAEFHYLHHRVDGARSPAMGQAIIAAAQDTGIRLLLLPVL